MYRRVLAFDFDGTLALNGDVSPEVETAMEQCRASGHVLFLVTGRRFETITLGHLGELLSGIVTIKERNSEQHSIRLCPRITKKSADHGRFVG